MIFARRFILLVLLVAPLTVFGAPCNGFTDVDSTSSFCNNVAWIKNRSITLGCSASLYCPDDPVSRLQMAAFLNRLGNVLTPTVIESSFLYNGSVTGTVRVCETADVVPPGYPRKAVVDLWATLIDPDANESMFGELVYSTDAGATWIDFGSSMLQTVAQGGMGATSAASTSTGATLDLSASFSYRFAAEFRRVQLAATTMLIRCTLRAQLYSRTGTFAPLDGAAP